MTARVESWLAERPSAELARMIGRIAETEDVVHVAVMPDAHVAEDVCVGTVTATNATLIPAAVGGDIGCGMVALGFDADVRALDERSATQLFDGLYARIPCARHRAKEAPALPAELGAPLSARSLEAMKQREARIELGTLGRGNHFIELQRDASDRLWVMLHSGSRAIGPAIRKHHESRSRRSPAAIEADSSAGAEYLQDVAWAIAYARANRARMLEAVIDIVGAVLGARPDESTRIECDHNHVRREQHGDRTSWVHRKGALSLGAGALGVVPGSMGSASFHVAGRGHEPALCSCAHGAGRAMSRSEAKRTISVRQLDRETRGVWFDRRIASRLREEAPSAYKEIGSVMRAQQELVRIVRRLEPLLVYKGA